MHRILFFIDTTLSSGGAEKVLRTLVNHMDREKFDITVLTSWPEDANKYLAPHIHYRSLYPAKNRLWRLVSRIEAALGLTYRLRMAGDYDLEIAYLEFGPTKILARSTNKRAKKLAWVHCDLSRVVTDPEGFRQKCGGWYRAFDGIVCVSQTVRHSLNELIGMEEKTHVLYNVVDSAEILSTAVQSPTLIRRRLTLVSVGRMYPAKGYDRLLRVHRRLLDEGFDHDLWILGDGPGRPELEAYCQDQGLTDSVQMPGFLDNPYPVIAVADALVCSSLYEGFSTVVTEALILGKSVVTTDCSGMDELLGDNECGIITENSEEGLYQGLKRFLSDPALRVRYDEAAKCRGRDFRLDALVAKTETFFTELLEGTSE